VTDTRRGPGGGCPDLDKAITDGLNDCLEDSRPDREITWVEASEWDDLERRRALRHLREVKRVLDDLGRPA